MVIAGSHDSPLSELGRRQATYAGQTAKEFFPFDLIVTSPMSRAVQTAEIVAEQLGYPRDRLLVLEELRERNLGDVEGRDYRHAPQHNGNYEDAENVPGVEPIESLYARASHVLEVLRARPEKRVLVVCHNGCGRMLETAWAADTPMGMYKRPRMENAVFYQLS